jgi:hypothetical protein
MRLGPRLLLPLLSAVAIVMGAYGVWAVVQREPNPAPRRRASEAPGRVLSRHPIRAHLDGSNA